jgi:hypothetical protein
MKDEKGIEKTVHTFLVDYMSGLLTQYDIQKATGFSRSTIQKYLATGITTPKKALTMQAEHPIVNDFVGTYVREPEMSLEVEFPAVEVVGRVENNRVIYQSRMNYEK